MRINILYFFLLFATVNLQSQHLVQYEEHDLVYINNSWLQLNNAAGLGLGDVKSHGVTELSYSLQGGDYHRAQEGNGRSGLNFSSERFDKLGKNWTSWGSFTFTMDREKNRAWSDVFSTYNSNPYIFGSSVAGNYDRQLFDFRIKISSIEKGRFTYGFGVDYLVGDLSRLRDPRTRVYLADYAFLPAITYRVNDNQHLGINMKAAYRKEKMPNITTVQDDPNLKYFSFFGLENADAIIGGFKGFQRQFISNFYGGELQYAIKNSNSEIVLAGGGLFEKQEILENLKQSPGNYNALNYNFRMIAKTISASKLYNLSLNAKFKSGSADEYLQKLISVNNPTTGVNSQSWVTLYTYENRYQNQNYEVQLNFNVRDINEQKNDYAWILGFEANASGFDNEYFLPYSQFSTNRINAAIYGHYRLLNKNNKRLTIKSKFELGKGINNTIKLNEGALLSPGIGASTITQGTYDIATNVIIPDISYFNANTYQATFETKYSFPLNFKKTKLLGYIKLNYYYLGTNTNTKWSGADVSIGIIP